MTPERIKELRALCEAATPGPWSVKNKYIMLLPAVVAGEDEDLVCEVQCDCRDGAWVGCGVGDVQLIAAARTALPEALNEIERQEHIIRALEETLEATLSVHCNKFVWKKTSGCGGFRRGVYAYLDDIIDTFFCLIADGQELASPYIPPFSQEQLMDLRAVADQALAEEEICGDPR